MKGSYLKIEGDHSDCGVSFVHTTSKEHIKLAASDIVLNEPSRLMLFVPASIPAGEYEISVTTQYTKGKTVRKSPRSITFDIPVEIA
jgi:hypothetical protein